jgi:hypothetical protein
VLGENGSSYTVLMGTLEREELLGLPRRGGGNVILKSILEKEDGVT